MRKAFDWKRSKISMLEKPYRNIMLNQMEGDKEWWVVMELGGGGISLFSYYQYLRKLLRNRVSAASNPSRVESSTQDRFHCTKLITGHPWRNKKYFKRNKATGTNKQKHKKTKEQSKYTNKQENKKGANDFFVCYLNVFLGEKMAEVFLSFYKTVSSTLHSNIYFFQNYWNLFCRIPSVISTALCRGRGKHI
jgi:hypothetical protein